MFSLGISRHSVYGVEQSFWKARNGLDIEVGLKPKNLHWRIHICMHAIAMLHTLYSVVEASLY